MYLVARHILLQISLTKAFIDFGSMRPIAPQIGKNHVKRQRSGWFIQSNALEISVRRASKSLPLSVASLDLLVMAVKS